MWVRASLNSDADAQLTVTLLQASGVCVKIDGPPTSGGFPFGFPLNQPFSFPLESSMTRATSKSNSKTCAILVEPAHSRANIIQAHSASESGRARAEGCQAVGFVQKWTSECLEDNPCVSYLKPQGQLYVLLGGGQLMVGHSFFMASRVWIRLKVTAPQRIAIYEST